MKDAERIARFCGWKRQKACLPGDPEATYYWKHESMPIRRKCHPSYRMNDLFADIGPIARAKELGWYLELNDREHLCALLNDETLEHLVSKDVNTVQSIRAAILKLIDYLEGEGDG